MRWLLQHFVNSWGQMTMVLLQVLLCRNLMVSFAMLERFYRTMKIGGLQSKRVVSVGFSYIDLMNIDQHCVGIESDKIDVETLKK
jgi:hypothetical protein